MNKAFEKILERLEEERELSYADFSRYVEEVSPCLDDEYDDFFHRGLERASRLVKEVAEEYNGGWIACSERLPEDDSICIVTVEYPNNETVIDYGWFDRKSVCWFVGMQEFITSNILAWQPLPEPFKEREANG